MPVATSTAAQRQQTNTVALKSRYLSPASKPCALASLVIALGAGTAGCGGSDGSRDDGADNGPSAPEPNGDDAAIRLTDAHNYRTETRLEIPSVEAKAQSDLEICWAEVSEDIQCHALDATQDIDNVALLRFNNLSHEEVQAKLVSTQLSMSDVLGYLERNTDGNSTCVQLSEFNFFGTEVPVVDEFVESETISYLLLFTTGTDAGVGARTLLFVEPKQASMVTRVDAPNGCGGDIQLDFSAELSSESVAVPAEGPWTVDWEQVVNDGAGHPVDNVFVDSLLVAFYADMSVSDLEQSILELQTDYTRMWEMEIVGGRRADLAGLADRDSGEPFTGFAEDGEGTWVLGLMCSTCQNPAPVVLAVLEPEAVQP
jgi:hypothetical protein